MSQPISPQKKTRRQLTPARRLAYLLLAPVAFGIVRLWWATLGRTEVVGAEHLAGALKSGAVLPAYWHGQQLLPIRYLLGLAGSGLRLGFLISPSVDGEVPAMLVARCGGHVIRGSSNTTGARAMRDFYEAMTLHGVSPAITPDGPTGPRQQCKPGALLLSQLSGRPILPIAFASRRVWRLKTWDRFVLPRPFTRSVLAVGEPIQVPRRLGEEGLEGWQARLATALGDLYELARQRLDGVKT
ncbi:MAG: lysophospholipid acyltransferase family protein [Steroidobacteraceae bacterium]